MAAKTSVGRGFANRLITYAFTVGIVIALILGLISAFLPAGVAATLTSLLILAGIVVGFFNITPAETRDYVLFVTALVVVTSLSTGVLGDVDIIGPLLQSVLGMIMAFIVPSVIIVAIKAVLNLAKN